jgi:hypothetical protein
MATAIGRLLLTSAALLCLGLAGCGKAAKTPDRMNMAEFQAWLSKETGMTDLSLTEQGGGKFTGTGKKNGKTWQITVTREARRANWEATFSDATTVEKITGYAAW